MEFGIDFYRDEPIDEMFVHGLFYRLVAEGARYNAAKYPGKFFIITPDPSEEVIREEEEIGEQTHKLSDIVTEYCSFDTSQTSLTVHLNYEGENNFVFDVAIRPRPDSSVVGIHTNTNEINTKDEFAEFITVCKNVIASFKFVHCRYTNEYKESVEFSREELVKTPLEVVTYYSNELANEIGRDKLTSAPAKSIEELNDGVFILACLNQTGACERLNDVREHLGQEKYW